jgi:hypothetical protein
MPGSTGLPEAYMLDIAGHCCLLNVSFRPFLPQCVDANKCIVDDMFLYDILLMN